MGGQEQSGEQLAARQAAMRVCAGATCGELAAIAGDMLTEDVHDLRRPEKGLVMIRGRIGGEGGPFNIGETTVIRAAVRLGGDGTAGFAYHLGRDGAKARAAAIIDALWQRPALRGKVDAALAPVARRLAQAAEQERQRTAATRVEFFTLARGED